MYLRFDDQSWTNPGNLLPAGRSVRFGRDERSDRQWNRRGLAMVRRTAPPSDSGTSAQAPSANGSAADLPTIELHGVRIHAISEAQTIQHIVGQWRRGLGGVVVTPNLDHLRRCRSDLHFAALLEEADLVVADGMPLIWASRLLGTPLPQRVAGSNLIWSLSEAAALDGKTIYLLGGAPGTADAAAAVLRERYPKLKIVGACCPAAGFENDPAAVNTLLCELKSLTPDVVYVALGSPKQEKLIARLKPFLPSTWWLGIGISLSFVCGDVKRAPLWMQRAGLEWTHRLAQEPRRLFKRYIVSGLPFAASLLAESAVRGVPGRFKRRRAIAGASLAATLIDATSTKVATDSDRSATDVTRQADTDTTGLSSSTAETNIPARPTSAEPASLAARAESLLRRADELQTLISTPKPGRIRAMVLLGGAMRQTPLTLAAGRSALDLPLDERGSVLAGWLHEAANLAAVGGLERLPVRLTVNPMAAVPTSVELGTGIGAALRIERDASEYRGTGGVLHDVAAAYHDDDYILVANAAQVLLDPLSDLVASLQNEAADVSLIAHDDGTPTGLMLVRCAALRSIAADGFVDMKEQALPHIATEFDVRVLYRYRPSGLPLRTLEDYILALRCHHRRDTLRRGESNTGDTTAPPVDPLAEDWTSAFSLIEPGANVDPTARVHDSVVLAGGAVESGAVLVRSVVCAGGIVRRDRTAVDRFVCRTRGREARNDRNTQPRHRSASPAQVEEATQA